jgi:hypothetical protein
MIDEKKIHEALGYLMQSCGYGLSNSETEAFFATLVEAIEDVDWEPVRKSHDEGPGCDVNLLLAQELAKKRRGT